MNVFKRKKCALQLGLKTIHDKDTFVVSFPKSGNTWVRFILANLISDELITLKNIDHFVSDIYNFKDKINASDQPRFIKTHHPNFNCYPKTIYVYRDYRDVLVSYYHYEKSLNLFAGNMAEFIRKTESSFSWSKHIKLALKHQQKYPEKMLMISYEDMSGNMEEVIHKILSFCEIEPNKKIEQVIERCSFESLQEIEQTYGRTFDTNNLTFFRSGKIEQWKNELSPADLALLSSDNKTVLNQLGYPDSI